MARRNLAVVSPAPAVSVLRRSARIKCRENRNGEGYFESSSIPASNTAENEKPPRKSRRELGREVSKRLVYTFDGLVEVSSSKKSLRSNSSMDGVCSMRRSSRVINSGRSDAEEEKSSRSSKNPASTSSRCLKSTIVSRESQGQSNSGGSCTLRRSPRFSSGGGSVSRSYSDGTNSGNSVLSRCNTKSILSEKRGKGENGMESRDRICRKSRSCVVQKTNQILRVCDKEQVSVSLSKRKKMKIAKPHAEVTEAYNEERNAIVESTAECMEEKREIVLGLISTGIASFSEPVLKIDNEKRRGKNLVDGREEEEPLMTKNILMEEGKCGGDVKGWTKEQELTLQRAYLAANPSPHFWKKVSKMVPGKSAQECFDKIHTDLITPREAKPRSRAKKTNLSPIPQFSLSASKLLKPISPKTKPRKRRNKLTKKTIRHLLEKQNHMDQSLGSDLFSVLEPNNTINLLSTPTEKTLSLSKFVESSSSGQKGQCSRFGIGSSNQTTLVSPPVLKQVKNKALHEKYIDHLHFREAKRRAESVRFAGKENIKPIDNIQKKDPVKDSLFFEVQDAIQKLKRFETENSSSSSEFCNGYGGETDEEEDGSM